MTALETGVATLSARLSPAAPSLDDDAAAFHDEVFQGSPNGGCIRGIVWAVVIEIVLLVPVSGIVYVLMHHR